MRAGVVLSLAIFVGASPCLGEDSDLQRRAAARPPGLALRVASTRRELCLAVRDAGMNGVRSPDRDQWKPSRLKPRCNSVIFGTRALEQVPLSGPR